MTQAVVECAADAIVAVDEHSRVTLWNPAAELMFGWPAAAMIGEIAPIVPAEHQAEYNAVLERVRAGQPISIGTRRTHRLGRLMDVRADTSALRGPGGGFAGWVCVYHPIEQVALVQHHMAERARLVRRLNDILADLNAQLDLDVVLDRITAALVELTGADAGGFVRIEDDRLRLVSTSGLPERMRGTVVGLRDSLVSEILRSGRTVMLASGARVDDLIWQELPGLHTIALGLSYLANRPYGALYALFSGRKAGHTELELLELLAGHAGVAVGNAVAYQEVVRQRAHERAVIDTSADGIAVLDREGLVCQWNPAATRISGVSHLAVLGEELPFPYAPGQVVTHQLESGTWLEILCARIEETGELVVDFRDITGAKALEEAKDLFLATTSHELRTPITVVRGFAETLVNRWEEMADGDRREAVSAIAHRARSLARLVEQLLLGSRAGAGKLVVNLEAFDLAALLAGTVSGFASLSDRHELDFEASAGLPRAFGDPLATDIIIGQLLENALKYSPDGGRIEVRAFAEDGTLVVTVTDQGVGIDLADHERIFERFVQGETGDCRRFGGVGLGLYIVKGLAQSQHGDIRALAGDGPGTRMRLVLPADHGET
ncbi:MAG: ATP-binding protein [Streptosporangiaceae bacterium]